MLDYEDTVMSAEGECCSCGMTVDEGDNHGEDGKWLCWDCLQDTVRSHTPATDWFAVAADVLTPYGGEADAALAGVDV